jgi:hypothetical protein
LILTRALAPRISGAQCHPPGNRRVAQTLKTALRKGETLELAAE